VIAVGICKEEVQQVYCCLLFYFHFGRKFDYFVEYWSGRLFLSLPLLVVLVLKKLTSILTAIDLSSYFHLSRTVSFPIYSNSQYDKTK